VARGRVRRGSRKAFIAEQEVVGVLPCARRQPSSSMAAAWPEYGARGRGGDMRRVRRCVVGWAAWRAWTCGAREVREKGGGMMVPQRTDQRTKGWPRRADPADHGAVAATPTWERALWSVRLLPDSA
jgi:hypothetical protein